MALFRITRQIPNVPTAGVNNDYVFGVRGGILLDVEITWYPHTFFNVGTEDESVKGGDIHVLLGDAATARPMLGMNTSPLHNIVVPAGGSWRWVHPHRSALLQAEATTGKLAFHSGFSQEPLGVLRGAFRVIAVTEPVRQVPHSILVEANFIAFDLNIT